MRRIVDYKGRAIRLTDERLEHILTHPEMRGMEGALEDVIRQPDTVVQSLSDAEVHLYYRFLKGTRVGDMYMCAVVKLAGDPFVITAYLTDRPKKGELVWRAIP